MQFLWFIYPRAGNKVQNIGCPLDNQHEYFGCLPYFSKFSVQKWEQKWKYDFDHAHNF